MNYKIKQKNNGTQELLNMNGDVRCYFNETNNRDMILSSVINDLLERLDKAIQLCDIANDWNINEVEIDDEMISIYELKEILNGTE